jgi:Regulator of ribonuclease activity B
MNVGADWPDDADGGVLRRLAAQGFDFSIPHEIDFNIDFENWPPPPDALGRIRECYPDVSSVDPDDGFNGYFLIRLFRKVTYEFVVETQRELSKFMAPFGGVCDSWGLFVEGAKDT